MFVSGIVDYQFRVLSRLAVTRIVRPVPAQLGRKGDIMRFLGLFFGLVVAANGVVNAGVFTASMNGAHIADGTISQPSGTLPGSMFNNLLGSRVGFGSFASTAIGGYAVNYETAFDNALNSQTVPNAKVRTDSSTFQVGDARYLNLTTYSAMLTGSGNSSVRNAFVVPFRYRVDRDFDYIYTAEVSEDNLAAVNAATPGHGTRTFGIFKDSALTRAVSNVGGVYNLSSGVRYYLAVTHESGNRLWSQGVTGANLNFKLTQFDTGSTVPERGSVAVFGLLGLAGWAKEFRRKK